MSKRKTYNFKTETLLEAIKGSGAIMSTIARKLNCDWSTAQKYILQNEKARQALSDEEETVLDMCESTLLQSIKEKDIQSAKWYLATKGKKRGYSERHELTGSEGTPIRVIWEKQKQE